MTKIANFKRILTLNFMLYYSKSWGVGYLMKKWFNKNIKIFIGAIPIIITFFIVICSDMEIERLITLLAVSFLFLVAINFSEITRLRIGKDGIDFEKEKLKELNREAQVTIDKLNSTIEPLLKFNLALLHKDAHFDNVTDFDAIANFLISSNELLEDMPLTIQKELRPYLDEGMGNALFSFSYKAESIIGYGKVRGFIDLGTLESDDQGISITGLRNLDNNAEYQEVVSKLEEFLRKFKPEKLKI